ncbi:MAG: hypothetical protein U5L74_11230 [Ideonella sp.]|nr:hypothetical protein [Ideonella sp.]
MMLLSGSRIKLDFAQAAWSDGGKSRWQSGLTVAGGCMDVQYYCCMWCLCLRREGQPIPRWAQRAERWHRGEMVAKEEFDELLGRHVLIARFFSEGRTTEAVAPLIDAKVLQVMPQRMIFAGLERDVLTRKEFAQTWMIVSDPQEPRGVADTRP